MLPEWRLLDDRILEAARHYAVEEALARLLDEGHSPPTLRLRQVKPAVFVGVHQDTWSEVNMDYCLANGIPVVRRMNGGGAVYHEMGNFCYSAFFRRDMFHQSDEELYRLFALPVIRTCADYGVDASFQGRNDVLVGERKIYGSAQFSWYTAFVQSGTFLINMNFEAMENALTPPILKFKGKPARSIQERVTSLSRECGLELDTREVMQRFITHFAELIGVKLIPGNLTNIEQTLTTKLLEVKYVTDKWNLGSPLEFEVTVAEKTDQGVISLSAEVEDGVIQRARITGDILLSHRQDLVQIEEEIAGYSIHQARNLVETKPFSPGLLHGLERLLEKLEKEILATTLARHKERAP